jgi:hypothetical protein
MPSFHPLTGSGIVCRKYTRFSIGGNNLTPLFHHWLATSSKIHSDFLQLSDLKLSVWFGPLALSKFERCGKFKGLPIFLFAGKQKKVTSIK